MSLYEKQLAKIEATKQFKADTQNTELMLTRHFNKIQGKSTSGTSNVFVNKSTGERSSVCQTCNFDVYATERGIDLNSGYDIVKNPVGQGFSIKQLDTTVSLVPEKLTNIRNLIQDRESLITQGYSTSLDLRKDSSITVDTSVPPVNSVNSTGLGSPLHASAGGSTSPRANEYRFTSVQGDDVVYGDESLETVQQEEKSTMDKFSQSMITGGIVSGSALGLGALALLLLSKRSKK